jgi:hypothetical protein
MHKELGAIKMGKKEKVKDFNQRFLNVLIKFPHDVALAQSLAIEYYMTSLTPSMEMFVKRANKNTLALNFDEVETVEGELSSYEHHSHTEEAKMTGKRPLLLTKPPKKEPKDIDNVVKLVKKLYNEVVDIKKNVGEGTSKPRTFRSFLKRQDSPPKPPEPPHMDFNLESFNNDRLCSYHQLNHPERTLPQWVNSMTLVINQLLYHESLNDEISAQAPTNTTDEIPLEFAMPFWTSVQNQMMNRLKKSLSKICQLSRLFPKEIIFYTTKDPIPNATSPKEDKIPLRKITPPILLQNQMTHLKGKSTTK